MTVTKTYGGDLMAVFLAVLLAVCAACELLLAMYFRKRCFRLEENVETLLQLNEDHGETILGLTEQRDRANRRADNADKALSEARDRELAQRAEINVLRDKLGLVARAVSAEHGKAVTK